MRLHARLISFVVIAIDLAGCGKGAALHAPFMPAAVRMLQPARVLSPRDLQPARATVARSGVGRYEYVFVSGGFVVYDVDHGFSVAERVRVSEAGAYRGVVVSPRTGEMYLSVGGNGGSSGHGALIAFDLRHDQILWERRFPTGTDNPAITSDGRTIFLPTGERSRDDVWWVVDAASGRVKGEIHAGLGPHNTIVMGRRVYLGPRNGRFLVVASACRCRKLDCSGYGALSADDRLLIGRFSGGGGSFSGRGVVVLVLVAAASGRAARAPASLGAGEGDRDRAAAASAAGAGASGRSARAGSG
jgi:hypothetical protein